MELAPIVLMFARMAVFALAVGLVIISFQAYRARQTDRLEAAFIGFAFLTMGFALTTLRPFAGDYRTIFEIVETIPFIIGFGMLYVSLYR